MSEEQNVSSRLHPGRAGSAWYYQKGCRCEECTVDARVKRRRFRDKARAEGRESYLRELEASREAKRRRTGICRECGGTTRYNGHKKAISDLCAECNNFKPVDRCKNGHLLTPEIRLDSKTQGNVCRICRNAYQREYTRRRRRAEGRPERDPSIYDSRRVVLVDGEGRS